MPTEFVRIVGSDGPAMDGYPDFLHIPVVSNVPARSSLLVGLINHVTASGGTPLVSSGGYVTWAVSQTYTHTGVFSKDLQLEIWYGLDAPAVIPDTAEILFSHTEGAVALEFSGLRELVTASGAGGNDGDTSPARTALDGHPKYLFLGLVGAVKRGTVAGVFGPRDAAPAAPNITIDESGEWIAASSVSCVNASQYANPGQIETPWASKTITLGYLLTDDPGPQQMTATVTGADFDAVALSVFCGLPDGGGPWNLETREGRYYVVYSAEGVIRSQVADGPKPPLGDPVDVSDGTGDIEPRIQTDGRRLFCVWGRPDGPDSSVLRRRSDDDAATWGDEVTIFDSGSHPTAVRDPRTGAMLYAAYAEGVLKGRLQYPGDTALGEEFIINAGGGPLEVDDDTFEIAPAANGQGHWMLVAVVDGEIKQYVSTDDARTFEET